jgi:hypothetical protein
MGTAPQNVSPAFELDRWWRSGSTSGQQDCGDLHPGTIRQGLGCTRVIDEEHRLVYLIGGEDIVMLQARYHYEC